MTEPDVARVLADALAGGTQWRGAYKRIPPDEAAWHYEYDDGCSYDTAKAARLALAALTAAGIACVYVPEGVEVEHGARLVDKGGWGSWQPYAIEPLEATDD